MNQVTQELLERYALSIDTLQKHVDEIRTLYLQIKKDYTDIEAAETAHNQMAHNDAVARLKLHRQQFSGPFYVLGSDAIGYYNAFGGNMVQAENESSMSTIIHHYTNINVFALILKTGHCAMNGR